MNNISLTGMPGAGKSTLGILLAKALGKEFIDTDVLLQSQYKNLLYEIIRTEGITEFLHREELLIKSLSVENTVIATGGSVVLSNEAMQHLQKIGKIIYLKLDIDTLHERIKNIETRGIVKENSQSLFEIFKIRTPLYEYFSNITIDCSNKDHEQVVNEIVSALK